jgi:hypothetical protein
VLCHTIAPRQSDPAAYSDLVARTAGPRDRGANQVEGWLWLLLRFAITRDPQDEFAAMIMASQIDSLRRQWGWSAPTFFRTWSAEVCKAIASPADRKRDAILNRHASRIEHPRLRRAFQAAVQGKKGGRVIGLRETSAAGLPNT